MSNRPQNIRQHTQKTKIQQIETLAKCIIYNIQYVRWINIINNTCYCVAPLAAGLEIKPSFLGTRMIPTLHAIKTKWVLFIRCNQFFFITRNLLQHHTCFTCPDYFLKSALFCSSIIAFSYNCIRLITKYFGKKEISAAAGLSSVDQWTGADILQSLRVLLLKCRLTENKKIPNNHPAST